MASGKIDPKVKVNNDTGFGQQAANIGGRFLNKDGTFNLKKRGWPLLKRVSFYSSLLELSWFQFLAIIIIFYLLANVFFTLIYLAIGTHQLGGFLSTTRWGHVKEVFFFSTQTFTTVGYGRINPIAEGADIIASVETLSGWLFFALVTGLLYGRFTRPQAYIAFSDKALISPYKEITAVMFRMVPYKDNHSLTDVRLSVNASIIISENGKDEYRFFSLALERSRIDMFNMNWTVVHPLDENSPLAQFTKEDFEASDIELIVQITGFDPIFSNNVTQRTSYTMKEFVYGARYQPMFHESEDGNTTILELDKLNAYEKVALNKAVAVP